MKQELIAADIIDRCTRAFIEALVMRAENELRVHQGFPPSYGEQSFMGLLEGHRLRQEDLAAVLSEEVPCA